MWRPWSGLPRAARLYLLLSPSLSLSVSACLCPSVLNEATHVNNKQTLKRKFCANNVGFTFFFSLLLLLLLLLFVCCKKRYGCGYVRRHAPAGTGTKVVLLQVLAKLLRACITSCSELVAKSVATLARIPPMPCPALPCAALSAH